MTSDNRTAVCGLDLNRMPVRPIHTPRWPLAGVAVLTCFTLVAGGSILMPHNQDNSAEAHVIHAENVTRLAPVSVTLAKPAVLRDPAAPPVSHQMRRPVRLTDKSAHMHDLQTQTRQVLAGFGHLSTSDDRLFAILVQSLAAGQSDAWIHAALSVAAARGEFLIPPELETVAGGIDTARLLQAFLDAQAG